MCWRTTKCQGLRKCQLLQLMISDFYCEEIKSLWLYDDLFLSLFALQVPELWEYSDVQKIKTSPHCILLLCLSAATGLWASADQIAVGKLGVTGCRWHRSLCLRCPCCPSLPGSFLVNLMPALTVLVLVLKSRGLFHADRGGS